MAISVLGAGSWGSALALALSHTDSVYLWSKSKEHIKLLQDTRTNHNYLPENVRFPANISFYDDINAVLDVDLIIIATPISAMRSILETLKKAYLNKNFPDIIWVCKGFELNTGMLPHQIIKEVLPECSNFGALLGPTFAAEVALSMPTAITLASFDTEFAKKWVHLLRDIPNFRVYANNDLVGAEIGAAVKNIIAIAAGIGDGLNLGLNARAGLITRSLREISELVKALGGKVETVYGLTGIGDLILTCTGNLSRNRTVGLELANGNKIEDVLKKIGHVAEGVPATREVYELAQKYNLEMPIVEAVYKIIYEGANVKSGVMELLKRAPKFE